MLVKDALITFKININAPRCQLNKLIHPQFFHNWLTFAYD